MVTILEQMIFFFLDTPHTTKYGLGNILYKATLLFNSLPSEIRNLSLSKFKKNNKESFFGCCNTARYPFVFLFYTLATFSYFCFLGL